MKFKYENSSDDELNELETDNLGRVITQEDLIQIQIRGNTNDIINVVGTITFHRVLNDFSFKGILNRDNSKKFLDIWFNTGISKFVLKELDDKEMFYYIDLFYYLNSDCQEQVKSFYEFLEQYPECELDRVKI
jgi:hypothetical protein